MRKVLFVLVTVLGILPISNHAQAVEVCDILVNNPPTNVRPWAGKDNNPIHVIKEETYVTPLEYSGDWLYAEVWVKDSTYKKGWIHNSQYSKNCYDQQVYSDSYYRYYDIADNAKFKKDYNTALINYRRAKNQFLIDNPDTSEVDDHLEAMILLMDSKR